MMRFCRVLAVLACLACPAHPSVADDGAAPAVRVGANQTTLEYVRSTIEYGTGHAGKATYQTLSDADLYRRFLEGRLDVVSVFGRPDRLGVDGFDAGFGRPPAELVVGHAACMAIVPADRNIEQLTLKQLADVVAGRITTWDQLGAGPGEIEIRADAAALAVLLLSTGAQPVQDILTDRRDTGENMSRYVDERVRQRRRSDASSAPKSDVLGLASAPSLLDGRRSRTFAALAPIAADERAQAVAPSLASIREGTYPLSTPWRILVHPDAPPHAAGFARLCLRGYEVLVNAEYVLEWLIGPRQDELGNVVRVFGLGRVERMRWEHTMGPLWVAYGDSNPDVTIGRVRFSGRHVEEFLDGNVDLLHNAGAFWPDDRKELAQLFGGTIAEQVIGHQPLLVLVHPTCPVNAMTLEQVRRIAEHDVIAWSQVGWTGEDAPVVKRARTWLVLQDSLFDRRMRPSAGGVHRDDAAMLQEARNDPHGVTFALAGDAVLASGLKVLAIADRQGNAALPTPANVVSGRYPARYPVIVLLHPQAGEPAGRLLRWLHGPEAGRILAARHVYTHAFAALGEPETPPRLPAKSVVMEEAVSGGVAVLPTECLSLYFLMAREEHRAAYDRAISEAVAADGRLQMLDREHIEKVLEERKTALLSGGSRRDEPIVAADVFVMPSIVTEGPKAFLRIQAYHGPTASLLSEVQAPIDPAAPTQFDPPLGETIAGWWPGVLKRLVAARSLPVWSVIAIHPGASGDAAAADRIAEQFRERLAAQSGLFLADYTRLDAAQQEVLLTAMGVGRPIAGPFTPVADVLVEGRLLENAALEVRLRSGKTMAVIAQRRFAGTRVPPVDEAAAWCLTHARLSNETTAGDDLHDWAAEQAQWDLQRYEQLKADYSALRIEAAARAAEQGRRGLLPADASALAALAESARQCATRAAQLDPANEAAAYAITLTRKGDSSFASYLQRAAACERYCDRFPQSPRWRGVMETAVVSWNQCHAYAGDVLRGAESLKVPAGMDHAKAARFYLGKTVRCQERYVRRFIDCYDDPKERRGSWWGFSSFVNIYQDRLAKHLVETDATPEQVRREVDQWAKLFDHRTDVGRPSEILHLHVLALKKDRAGFVTALTDLQKAHPNPKDAYWAESKEWLTGRIMDLFREAAGRCNFTAWLEGRRGPGGLPYDGYDPSRNR